MINEICNSLKNYFTDASDMHFGKFTISSGSIEPLSFLKNGQYFRIVGSTFNDGVYNYPACNLIDEEFDGAIWAMKLPRDFIALCEEIKKFDESTEASRFDSESWNGYSYSLAKDSDGQQVTWKTKFRKKLNQYRKI